MTVAKASKLDLVALPTPEMYTPEFFDGQIDLAVSSAKVVVPSVLTRIGSIGSVIDVGCGRGAWAAEFASRGISVVGIDGAYVADRLEGFTFVEHDLTDTLPETPSADLVVCLEVAEHLPETRAQSFVSELCALGVRVLFSAAIPHQYGTGHINCQWQSWWVDLFESQGMFVDGSLRWPMWDDPDVAPWYRQNLLLFGPAKTVDSGPIDVVHPEIHEWGRWPLRHIDPVSGLAVDDPMEVAGPRD